MMGNMKAIKNNRGLIHLFYLIRSSCFNTFNISKSAKKVILTILFFTIACENT